MGSDWLLNSTKRLCQQPCSQSLMIIQWKLLKVIEQTNSLAAALVPKIGPVFFKRAYKNELMHVNKQVADQDCKFHIYYL